MRHIIAFCLLVASASGGFAQSNRISNGTLNFAVPDAPAFSVIGDDPPNIIRPANLRELGAGVGDVFKSGGVLPRSLFVEFSPWSVVGASMTFDDYKSSAWERFLYRMRLSLASRFTDLETGASYSSWGMRLTFEDQSDPRLDNAFVSAIRGVIDRDLAVIDPTRLSFPGSGTDSNWTTSLSPSQQSSLAASGETLAQIRAAQLAKSWNAPIFEGGVAVRYRNPDSLVKHVVIDRAAVWLTKTFGLSNWGQILLGTAPCMMRSVATGAMDSVNASLSTRIYGGMNVGKLFIEAQVGMAGRTGVLASDAFDPFGGIHIGGEYNVTGALWLEFGVSGLRNFKTGTSSYATPSIKVRWGSLPG